MKDPSLAAELLTLISSSAPGLYIISHHRRMGKNYERLCSTSEAFVYAAMTRLMVRRLARA